MPELPLISPLDRALFLRAHPFFQAEPRALIAIAEHSREVRFSAGETLIVEGEENRCFFILVDGSVGAWDSGEKLYDIKPPATVGLVPVLAGRSLDSSVIALEETTTLELEIDALLQILEDYFGLVLSMTGALARVLAMAEENAGIAPGVKSPPGVPMSIPGGEPDLVDRLSYVRRHPLFARANLGLLAELFRGDIVRHFDDGEFLCRSGETPGAFEVVIDGLIRLEDAGRSRTGFIDAIGVVGWRDIFTGKPRVWNGIACGPVRTLHVPRDLYTDVLEDHFDHTLAVVGQLAQRYIEIYSKRSIRLAKGGEV